MITHVSDGTYVTPASGTSAVMGAPASTALNDIIIAFLYKENVNAVTLPAGEGFTEFGHEACTGAQDHDTYIYWKRSDGSEPANYTFSWTGSAFKTGWAAAFRGCIATGSPVEAYDGANTGSSANATSPAVAVTTLGPDRMLLWYAGTYDDTLWVVPAGYTEMAPSGMDADGLTRGAYVIKAAAGATGNVQVTTTGTAYTKTAHLAALIPLTVPAPPPPTRRRRTPFLVR